MQLISLELFGYVGPGGGIALLGPLVGVLLAVFGALFMIALWPIRLMIKRARRASDSAARRNVASSDQS